MQASRPALLFGCLALGACSSSSSPAAPHDAGLDAGEPDGAPQTDAAETSPPADAGSDAPWVVAQHTAMPQVINSGGPVLAAPVATAVTFPGYDQTGTAEMLLATLGATAYWKAAVGEYGVGPIMAATPIRLTETAPTAIDDSAIQTWLAGKLDGTHPEFGTPTSNSAYVLFYPTGTSITLMGQTSCTDLDGFHNSTQLPAGPWKGLNVAYAVIPECGALGPITASVSHELAEATTDPYPLSANPGPSYNGVTGFYAPWEIVLGGGELGDMCAQFPGASFTPSGYAYEVQRIWSNVNAAADHDPCQPAPAGQVYFNAAPVFTDFVTIQYGPQSFHSVGALVPIGQSKTVEVDLYSDGPMAPWTVAALDVAGGQLLQLQFDTTTGQNGDKLHLTVTPLKADPQTGGEPFVIASKSGATTHFWIGYAAQN